VNIPDLIAWHVRMSASDAPDAAMHLDAAELLRWCVELPCVSPDPHARAYALETLLELSALQIAEIVEEMEPESLEDQDDGPAIELRLWRGLNSSISQQIWGAA
jgi:hypothetical protein